MKNIQAQYQDLLEGKMSKANFMRNVRMQFPQHISPVTSYDDSIKILKGKRILNEDKKPIGVYGHNPNAETDKYRGIDYVNYYQAYKGIQYELSKMPEITDENYIKAREKAVANIMKNPDAYKDLQLANFKAVKDMDKDLKMKEVKKDNLVDKPNEMKVVKKDVGGNTQATLQKKEAKKAKNGKGLQHMTQTPKGKLEAFPTPGKEKTLKEATSKVGLTKQHQDQISDLSPEQKKKLYDDLTDATAEVNDKDFKTRAEYAKAMKDAKTKVYKKYIKLEAFPTPGKEKTLKEAEEKVKKNVTDIVLKLTDSSLKHFQKTPTFNNLLHPNQLKNLKVGDNKLSVNNTVLGKLERMASPGDYTVTRVKTEIQALKEGLKGKFDSDDNIYTYDHLINTDSPNKEQLAKVKAAIEADKEELKKRGKKAKYVKGDTVPYLELIKESVEEALPGMASGMHGSKDFQKAMGIEDDSPYKDSAEDEFNSLSSNKYVTFKNCEKCPEETGRLIKDLGDQVVIHLDGVEHRISKDKIIKKGIGDKVKALKEHILDELTQPNLEHEYINVGSRVKKKGAKEYDAAQVGNVTEFDGDTATVKWDNDSIEHVQVNILTKKDIPAPSKEDSPLAKMPDIGGMGQSWLKQQVKEDPIGQQAAGNPEEEAELRASKIVKLKEKLVKAVKELLYRDQKTQRVQSFKPDDPITKDPEFNKVFKRV